MKEVIEEALGLMEKGEPCVLATVIHTKGSTPQKAGAKLLIRKDGSCAGTLGGGCVEGEIWSVAKQLLSTQGDPLYRKYDLNEAFTARDGLVCGGTMFFFIDPLASTGNFQSFATEIVRAYRGEMPAALATVVNSPTGRPKLGSKLLIREDGTVQGSFDNRKLELETIAIGKILAIHGGSRHFKTADDTEIFLEGFTSPPTLILIGGGHVNQAVSKLASLLGFRMYVIDDRVEFADKERFPEAETLVISDYSRGLENVSVNSNTYIVVATRGHRYDDLALAAAIRTQARYIGLLGSRRKTIEIYKNLLKEKVPPERLRGVYAPIGLNIGAITPEELAVSIMAEIIMVRNGGDGMSMKMNTANLDTLMKHEDPDQAL
ncbi:MAG: hypothetical protein DYG83_02555 [Candidatus Brocadia sp. AMX2]|uniref:Xanthine and CO dehydrogenases maturation factor XdhC/CoxF family n=1 Tax=Candidatus Brocadia sinica JPN1 TaxID=1197129 RepID=A0ABQ0JXL8_9BACT|nr:MULTISPECIES: XdhC/CoxI family protein [Brocadia]MBC6931031.1 hypothetical protein [Candidatus Brocadia sp.]MBL1168192.1 hypothetical protein [Candidatus Brocadia sp. AMX1]NOG40965.1 hypothetical protein [Planctomycetota bacterium]GIK13067.1 MAG: xanthine dehydrogenase [Candidatus Brocadia sinica]KAA0244302.1 MAG: hypothetical protein EDM70_07075 [Candidatus Brocadia sp. AMX2]